MPVTDTVKKAVSNATPVYAAVGVTDLAVEKVREARAQAVKTREQVIAQAHAAREENPLGSLPTKAQASATTLLDQVQAYPELVRERGTTAATKAQESYESFAARGADLVKRIREQQSTKELLAQAETTVALGKGAVTSIRHALGDIERSAKATLTIGRKEVAETVDTISESVKDEVETASEDVAESAKRTKTAAKSTSTTARKRASTAKSSTKAATTSARKTASKSTKAASKAADKVGD